jgi:hypothetical protein
VLPTYHDPYAPVRKLADFAGQRRVEISTVGAGPVTCIEPDIDTVTAYVMAQFPGSLILESEHPEGMNIGPYVTTDGPGLVRHMTEHHRTPAGYIRTAEQMYELQRYHGYLHQQTMVYPLPVQHWHA